MIAVLEQIQPLFSNVSFCQQGAHYHVERGLGHASWRHHFLTGAECWRWEHRHVYYRVRFPLRAAAFLNERCLAWKVITDAYLEMFLLTVSQKMLKMSFFFLLFTKVTVTTIQFFYNNFFKFLVEYHMVKVQCKQKIKTISLQHFILKEQQSLWFSTSKTDWNI